jgi:hypothetical protein
MLRRGNINLFKRPHVRNKDGSVSTVRSKTFEMDGRHVVLPTVVGRRVVDDTEAVREYRRTGRHLGIFRDERSATRYAKALHKQQALLLRMGR